MCGYGRLQPGGHGRVHDEREHGFGCVVGQRPAVARGEAVGCGRADHVGQDVGEQLPSHGLAVALGVVGGAAGRHGGGDEVGDVLAVGGEVLGGVPGVGGGGEVRVVR